MGVLKGIGTVICSILLFLALTVFSVVFMVNGTVLNAGFVNKQVDKLDISTMTQDIVQEQISDELPANAVFLQDVSAKILDAEEPLIKTQIHTGINAVYDYFTGKSDEFGIAVSFKEIKQDLKNNLWQTAVDYLKEKMAPMSEDEAYRYADSIRQQIPPDVLPEELSIVPEQLRNDIIDRYLMELGGKGSVASLMSLVNFVIGDQVEGYFNDYFSTTIDQIPDAYSIDESNFDAGSLQGIHDARTYIGYFKVTYIWLIVFMVVMAGLIFLINFRNVKASLRSLGIDLLIFGILDLAGVIIAMSLTISPQNPVIADLSPAMQTWVQGLIHDVSIVALPLSIGVLAAGVILTVLSFFVKKPETA